MATVTVMPLLLPCIEAGGSQDNWPGLHAETLPPKYQETKSQAPSWGGWAVTSHHRLSPQDRFGTSTTLCPPPDSPSLFCLKQSLTAHPWLAWNSRRAICSASQRGSVPHPACAVLFDKPWWILIEAKIKTKSSQPQNQQTQSIKG